MEVHEPSLVDISVCSQADNLLYFVEEALNLGHILKRVFLA